ncbi:conserved hypothetical protein [Hyella patelloides LEGE 07179]|uniref:N-acetyltransferase domain-containing protein n=1 Tax=Hyella patelloides LEGE 07179 TaxID=945734 RepID=A0A563VMX6_9CYAN|nr:GNAT family N-acetyltransferase [Hyella patelloides]VEP12806.1 conserved hypothetical protein [Hyella patelloides LEGE 07179]
MNLKIRKAQPSESEILSSLALCSKAYWGYSSKFIDACREELTYSQEDIQNNYFFVAEIDGRKCQRSISRFHLSLLSRPDGTNGDSHIDSLLIGFYALEVLSSTEIQLEALFIQPSYINQGYGRKLLEHAKVTASNLGSKVIKIQGDPNAKNFYLKVGGNLTGEIESTSIPGRYLPTFVIYLDEVDKLIL